MIGRAPGRPQGIRRGWAILAPVLAILLASCGGASRAAPAAPSSSFGIVQDRPVPAVPLMDQEGRARSLAAFRGKVVVMAPFLSLCQEECPLTTGAFISMQRDVRQAGLGKQVVFMGVSVDPDRDSPARLSAYSRQFGADWPLLTGGDASIQRLWRFFGIYYQKVPEGQPPGIDWWTHQALTYDVDHSDGFILLDTRGHERFITTTPPDLYGKLNPSLRPLLDNQGVQNLQHQPGPSWTVPQALGAIGWLTGRDIPRVTG